MSSNNISYDFGGAGIGDRLTDITVLYILCKYLNYKVHIYFNQHIETKQAWGVNSFFDLRLFDFPQNDNIIFKNNYTIPDNFEKKIYLPYSASSGCPYNVYRYLKTIIPSLTFDEIISKWGNYAKEIIKPSKIILDKIPANLENTYGIHLRKTDKISEPYDTNADYRIVNMKSEFIFIINNLLEDVKKIIDTEDQPSFLVVSEDNEWKNKITNIINYYANDNNKKINIIKINYDNPDNIINYEAVLDLFCLSKCKKIFQGVKVSSFSNIAAIIGNNKLINYGHLLESNNILYTHIYRPIININGKIEYDINLMEKILLGIPFIQTNIRSIYSS
jgi:hypothetical protein